MIRQCNGAMGVGSSSMKNEKPELGHLNGFDRATAWKVCKKRMSSFDSNTCSWKGRPRSHSPLESYAPHQEANTLAGHMQAFVCDVLDIFDSRNTFQKPIRKQQKERENVLKCRPSSIGKSPFANQMKDSRFHKHTIARYQFEWRSNNTNV